jgi:uncharacterized protein (TIGR03083 family)
MDPVKKTMTAHESNGTAELNDGALEALIRAIDGSAQGLADLVEQLTPEQLRQQAYPTEWTVAEVLSHLGSGATIMRLRLDSTVVDMQGIWDEWNAKDPDAQVADSLVADEALQYRLYSLTAEDEDHMRFAMGPAELDLRTFLALRLNEHSLHTWDVAVTFDAAATLSDGEAALIVDTLPMIVRWAGKSTSTERDLSIRTVSPDRTFVLALRADGVALSAVDPVDPAVAVEPVEPVEPVDKPDLVLPAEALIRLVYGRLDPDHTPRGIVGVGHLDELRRVFPGF